VIIKQPPGAKLCFTSRHLTSLVAVAVVKLDVRPQIVRRRKSSAAARDVTLCTYQHNRQLAGIAAVAQQSSLSANYQPVTADKELLL